MPAAFIFGSQNGTHGFYVRVERQGPDVDRITGRLFTYDRKGREKILWERRLDYVPRRVLVSDFGAVVALNEWARRGFEHALVVFDGSGNVIADYELEDLLGPQEIASKVRQTASNRLWDFYSAVKFTREDLCIRLEWGKEIKIDLATGKLLRN